MIKMNCLYIPLLLCMLTTGILCDNLSEAVRKTCNFNMSQYSSLNDQEEFKLCKQFNVTSVISNEQISDETMVNVRCKLYYESLVSMCLVNDSREKFWTLLKTAKTDNVTIEDVCNNTLSIKPESMFVHNFIQKNEPCKHFCLDYRRGQPVLSSICAKSYMFDKEMDLINTKTVPRQEESMTEKIGINKVEVNSNEGESDHKPIASDDENKDPITTPNIEEPSDKIKENLNSDVSKPNVETASNNQPKVEELNVSMNKPAKLTPKVPVAAVNEQITKIEEQNLRNQYTDNYFDDDQQAPPTNPQVDDKNAEDKIPENMEKNDRKTKLDKELKRPDPLMDAQDGNIEDDEEDEEAIPDKFKAPKVSQLSERFRYDSDLNGNSYFFTYFSFTCVILIMGYVLYHNKQKVLALLVEGRHSKRPQRSRRPNSANYHKLDTNLEEAISSSVSKNTTHVIY